MSNAVLRCCLALVLATGPAQALAQGAPPPTDKDVAQGVRLVDEGEYDAAILALDAAARRLAQEAGQQKALSEAYLYLGIAYLGKGHETSAKARFRDALAQVKTLNVTPDRFAPRVVELFEQAREEMASLPASSSGPASAAAPAPKKGGSKTLLVVGGLAVVGGGVAVAASGGGAKAKADPSGNGGQHATNFVNETVRVGAGQDYLVSVTGRGTLTARLTWQPSGVLLDMFVVAVGSPRDVLANATRTGANEATLSLPVTAQNYRIAVTHSSGQGLQADATFTLNVQHP